MNYKAFIRPGRGASDITPLLVDGPCFHELIDALAALFAGAPIDKVACIEGRGFLLGSALAYRLATGLIPLRSTGKLKAALPVHVVSFVDYSGQEKSLEMHADAVHRGERILIIDDWVQTAATVLAAVQLIECTGGRVAGIGALMDDTNPAMRSTLQPYNYRYIEQTAAGDSF